MAPRIAINCWREACLLKWLRAARLCRHDIHIHLAKYLLDRITLAINLPQTVTCGVMRMGLSHAHLEFSRAQKIKPPNLHFFLRLIHRGKYFRPMPSFPAFSCRALPAIMSRHLPKPLLQLERARLPSRHPSVRQSKPSLRPSLNPRLARPTFA